MTSHLSIPRVSGLLDENLNCDLLINCVTNNYGVELVLRAHHKTSNSMDNFTALQVIRSINIFKP